MNQVLECSTNDSDCRSQRETTQRYEPKILINCTNCSHYVDLQPNCILSMQIHTNNVLRYDTKSCSFMLIILLLSKQTYTYSTHTYTHMQWSPVCWCYFCSSGFALCYGSAGAGWLSSLLVSIRPTLQLLLLPPLQVSRKLHSSENWQLPPWFSALFSGWP